MKKRIILYVIAVVIGIIVGCNQFNKRIREDTLELVKDYKQQLESGSSSFTYGDLVCSIPNDELFSFTIDRGSISKLNFFTATDNIEKFVKTEVLDTSKGVLERNFKRTFLFEVRELDDNFEVLVTKIPYNCDFDNFKLVSAGEYDLTSFLTEPENCNNVVDSKLKTLDKYKTWEISGECPLKWDTIKQYVSLSKSGNLKLDKTTMLKDYVRSMSAYYNTVGKDHLVHLAKQDVTVSGGTYGYIVDEDKTIDYLLETHKKYGKFEEVSPIYKQRTYTKINGQDDVGNTFIFVSIDSQHVDVYKDGKIIKKSDCVTGTNGIHDTPTGVYFVSEVMPQGKYLRGDDYVTWVDHWYRLTPTGIGLHDADWRSNFGGTIYKTSGSHGCINLPEDFANWLESFICYGIPVVIK